MKNVELYCNECINNINDHDLDYYYSVVASHIGTEVHLNSRHFCSWKCLTNDFGKYFGMGEDGYRYYVEMVSKERR